MNRKKASKPSYPTEENTRWDFVCKGQPVPALNRGTVVLVDYYGRRKTAVVTTRVPGGLYWAQLTVPLSHGTRCLVTMRSLIAVASDAK
jgi:hypothetical protein